MSDSSISTLRAMNQKYKDQSVKGNLFSFDIDLIEEEPGFNPRNYEREDVKAHIENLALAYANGDYVPELLVKVIDGRIFLRDGHCRLRGAKLARERGADIRRLSLHETKGDEIAQSVIILTSNDGLALTPIERANIYVRLLNHGLTLDEIASKVQKTRNHVVQYTQLYDLPKDIKRMIDDGRVAWTLALSTFKEMGTEAASYLANAIGKIEENTNEADLTQSEMQTIVKPKKRLTPGKLSESSGYRSRFTPSLVKSVTDEISNVVGKLKNIDDGVQIVSLEFSRDEIDALLKLYREIKPKLTLQSEDSNSELAEDENKKEE